MSKCFIFSRVSTTKQEYGQIDNIVDLARSCGYKDEGMFFSEEKESGKNKVVRKRASDLNRMNTLIESDKSKGCLFASEVNHLAITKIVHFNRFVLLTILPF